MKGLSFEIEGVISAIHKEQQITDRFSKRTFKVFVLNEKNEIYSDVFELELKNDKCALIDQFSVGDAVECKCGLSGRDWQNRDGDPVYDKTGKQINSTTINCWYIVPLDRSDLQEKHDAKESAPVQESDENELLSPHSEPEEQLYNTSSQDFEEMKPDDLPF